MPFRSRNDQPRPDRFTARQLTIIVVAVSAAIISLPVGVYAATTTVVSIADPTNPSLEAHVDAAGQLEVGNGTGALTVDGAIRVAPPANPFIRDGNFSGVNALLGPTSSPIDVTSLAASTESSTNSIVFLYVGLYPSSATSCKGEALSVRHIWYLHDLTKVAPVTAAFPTPLSAPAPPSNEKNCLFLQVSAPTSVTVGGYLGL